MDTEIFFYLIPAIMILGGPLLFIAFSKSDKVNQYLFEHKKSLWIQLGSHSGVFKKVDSEVKDPLSIMKFNWAIISGKINKEVEDEEILSDLKTIKTCTLLWNLMAIPLAILFFTQMLNLK